MLQVAAENRGITLNRDTHAISFPLDNLNRGKLTVQMSLETQSIG